MLKSDSADSVNPGVNPASDEHTVIAVDLTPDECRVIQECLDASEIKLRQARSVDDALEQALGSAPVVLCDADPRRDWKKSLRQFRQRWPSSRVVFLSRLSDERMWIDMLEAGAYDLLLKPFRRAEISWIVRGALLSGGMTSAAHR